MLQTAKAEIFNRDESRKASSRILFDPCSQRTYSTDNLRKTLKLKTVKKETILIIFLFCDWQGSSRTTFVPLPELVKLNVKKMLIQFLP